MEVLGMVLVAVIGLASAVIVALINNGGAKRLGIALEEQKTMLRQHIGADEINAQQIDKRFSTLERHSTENYQASLWGRMRDKDLPLEERADAAQKYLDAGYNGSRKAYATALVDDYRTKCLAKEGGL